MNSSLEPVILIIVVGLLSAYLIYFGINGLFRKRNAALPSRSGAGIIRYPQSILIFCSTIAMGIVFALMVFEYLVFGG